MCLRQRTKTACSRRPLTSTTPSRIKLWQTVRPECYRPLSLSVQTALTSLSCSTAPSIGFYSTAFPLSQPNISSNSLDWLHPSPEFVSVRLKLCDYGVRRIYMYCITHSTSVALRKMCCFYFYTNFGNYGPCLMVLLLPNSKINCRKSYNKVYYITSLICCRTTLWIAQLIAARHPTWMNSCATSRSEAIFLFRENFW